jgi:hypothetical protein
MGCRFRISRMAVWYLVASHEAGPSSSWGIKRNRRSYSELSFSNVEYAVGDIVG